MALPSSGQISLGGVGINGNSVNVELGNNTTAEISLNQITVRTLFQKLSGAISMSDGWGKSSGTPANVINGYYDDGQDQYFCADGDFQCIGGGQYWVYVVSGTLPITWEFHMASNGCANEVTVSSPGSGYSYGVIQTGTAPNFTAGQLYAGSPPAWLVYAHTDSNWGTYTGGYQYRSAHYRLYVYNNVGSDYSAWSQNYGDYCYYSNYCYCGWCQGCGDNGASYGCYNCSPGYTCEPCDYDCSGDCATGYAAVCECDPSADDWCEPNCPCTPYACSETYGCPCGESCQYGDRYCEDGCNSSYTGYYPDGNCN